MSLPPLNALRAFEAAARTGSYVAAGRELGVTAAAISQHVKSLEAFWGRKLFLRDGNRIVLTDAGLASVPELTRIMGMVERLSDSMTRSQRRARFVLSVPHSVAETWLPERLARCFGPGESRPVQLRIEEDPVDFTRDRIGLRLYYGSGLYPGLQERRLFSDRFVAVARCDLVEAQGTNLASFPDGMLIHTDWGAGYASDPDFSRLLSGQRVVDISAGLRVPASSIALRYAETGLGVALVPETMARSALDAGRLQKLGAEVPMAHPYSAAYPAPGQKSALLQRILDVVGGENPAVATE